MIDFPLENKLPEQIEDALAKGNIKEIVEKLNDLLFELKETKFISGYSFKSEDHYEMFIFCHILFATFWSNKNW